MHIKGETIDDLIREVYEKILSEGETVSPTKGRNRELFGVILELEKPLARVSRTEMRGRLYSALGELFWYLAGSDDLAFVQYYIGKKDGYVSEKGRNAVWGAYGPRLFRMRGGIDQVAQVRKLLSVRPASRKAVIQLFNAEDITEHHEDVPCTCTLQFCVRATGLDMFVSMRSNDAYKGLPHDIFAFTMLQEILARDLGVPIGRYKHAAGSLHLYQADESGAKEFITEAWQDVIEMPQMPNGAPWTAIAVLKRIEEQIRSGNEVDVDQQGLEPYWADLARLLQIFALTKNASAKKNLDKVNKLAKSMASDFFRPYISDRRRRISG